MIEKIIDKTKNIFIIIAFTFMCIAIIFYIGSLIYHIYGNTVSPYIITVNDSSFYIKEYYEENGYYYATTIGGNECKIPIGIAVIKENK